MGFSFAKYNNQGQGLLFYCRILLYDGLSQTILMGEKVGEIRTYDYLAAEDPG
jgi:hypothetical protein